MNLIDDLQTTLEAVGRSVEPTSPPNLAGVKARAAQRRRRRSQRNILAASMAVFAIGGAMLALARSDDDGVFVDTEPAEEIEDERSNPAENDDQPVDESDEPVPAAGLEPAEITWTQAQADVSLAEVTWTGDRFLGAQPIAGEVGSDPELGLMALSTSVDGLTWTGLPLEVAGNDVVLAGDGEHLAVIGLSADAGLFGFLDDIASTEVLHYSADGGRTWSRRSFPDQVRRSPTSPYISRTLSLTGLALQGDLIVATVQSFDIIDVVALVGDRTTVDVAVFGGYEVSGDAIVVTSADDQTETTFGFDELALTDEERAALFTIEPDSMVLRSSGVDQPLVPVDGLVAGLAQVVSAGDGFLALTAWSTGTWTSSDGLSWERAATAGGPGSTLDGYGDLLGLIDTDGIRQQLLLSGDGGVTWEAAGLPVEATEIIDLEVGQAGVAVTYLVDSEQFDSSDTTVVIEKDGYRVILDDQATVVDIASGETVLQVSEDEAMSGGSPTVILGRDALFTFLDPESGEPLVSITAADFTDQMVADGEIGVIWSADGVEWRSLSGIDPTNGGELQVPGALAVGTDRLVIGLANGNVATGDGSPTLVGIPVN